MGKAGAKAALWTQDQALGAAYFFYFAAAGVLVSYQSGYLRQLGLSPREIGLLLAVGPTVAIVLPTLWGTLADRLGRPERVAQLVGIGCAVTYPGVMAFHGLAPLLLVLTLYAAFSSGVTTVLDSLAIRRAALRRGSFGRTRSAASWGYLAAAAGLGLLLDETDWGVPTAASALLIAFAAACLALPRSEPHAMPPPSVASPARLLHPSMIVFLLAACLHWIAAAPYHGLLALHFQDLSLPTRFIGFSSAAGVLAEIAVFSVQPWLQRRISPKVLLVGAFFVTAGRWALMSVTTSAWALVGLALLHGFTFGAFYLAAIALLSERVPEALRARGQGLFVSTTFGVGGLIGHLSSGWLYASWGGSRLFLGASLVSVLSALVAAAIPSRGRILMDGAASDP